MVVGWILAGVIPATVLAPARADSPEQPIVASVAHRRAAERHARLDPVLRATFRRDCSSSSGPTTAALAAQRLQQAEADYRAERALPRPRADRLLMAVVARGCAAYHATRLHPGTSYPVWLQSQVRIEEIKPAATGFEVQARATTVDGAVENSRITFSRGLHHACFQLTDAKGKVHCVMVDTHPHGDRVNGWAEAHEGPLVVTLAGSVSPTRVELPAVEFRDFPVFVGAAGFR